MIGLEFGCGEKPRKPKYLGVDVRDLPTVKYVCNAWDIDQHVEENSVDNIYSRHFFEHLTFQQADMTLTSWKKILKTGGIITTLVPDMAWHVKQWLNPNRSTSLSNGMTDQQRALDGFWGKQRSDENVTNLWDYHKSGYDFRLMNDILLKHGFSDIKHVKDKPKNLHVTCRK